MADDRYQAITEMVLGRLVGRVEAWRAPWDKGVDGVFAFGGKPQRVDGIPYGGDCLEDLWVAAARDGHTFPTWMTAGEAETHNGRVRQGEKGEIIFYATLPDGSFLDEGTVVEEAFPDRVRLVEYEVFNVGQIDGLPPQFYRRAWEFHPHNTDERNLHADGFFRDLGVIIRHEVEDDGEGAVAKYDIRDDQVTMPPWELFGGALGYYETLAHEVMHWATSRKRAGDRGWPEVEVGVAERELELVAELGSAFLCADLGISPVPRYARASYIGSWLRDRGEGPLAGWIPVAWASGRAERAVGWLHQLAPGYRLDPDITYPDGGGGMFRAAPDADQPLIAARDARRFVVAVEALRARGGGGADHAWQREAVNLLVEARAIDLNVAGVAVAIEAEVVIARADRASQRVDAGTYIEAFRRDTWRWLEVMVSESGWRRDRGVAPGRRM